MALQQRQRLAIILIFVTSMFFYACFESGSEDGGGTSGDDTVVNISEIPGVTPPNYGETPVTEITATSQYTGTVSWYPGDNLFGASTIYTATITLTAKPGYTLSGVTANFFTVAGATGDTNDADSGVITAVFPETGAAPPTVINIAAIPGVTPPNYGETPVTEITSTSQYTGTVSWYPGDNLFGASTAYTATITLTAKPGYTLTGVTANFFTVAGTTSDANSANSGVVTAVFPPTGAVTYALGDFGPSGVGKVFYITDGGLHGLEAATVDQSEGAAWSNVTSTLIGTTGTAIGDGSGNTDDIIGQEGHTGSAAQICRSYNGGGYSDWFLPSIYELEELYDNRAYVGVFADAYYWSSSEIDKDGAQRVNFFNGQTSGGLKTSSTTRVRAVRAF